MMYSPLNEDYMFQEMKNRTDEPDPSPTRGRRRTCRAPLVASRWQPKRAPCGMMTDVRIDRSRTEGLVGRDSELQVLLGSALGTDPARMVLLSGDAGVGKTRLLSEAVDRLTRDGWRALVGHCLDFGETSIPYLPFAEMIGQVGDAAPGSSSASSIPPWRGCATAPLPTTRPRVSTGPRSSRRCWPSSRTSSPAAPSCSSSRTPTGPTPAPATCSASCSPARIQGRCLLVVTFRSDEMHRRHPLRQRVPPSGSACPASSGSSSTRCRRPSAVRRADPRAVSGSADEHYDEDIERIVQRSQGNAFYVEELVSAFLGGGWSLPEDLADLLLVRLDRLDESARAVVRVASAAGQRVPHDLLARVAPVTEDDLEIALRAAIDANVLVRTGDAEYAFRHALLGEAVYDDLLPGERMRLHTAYAEAVRELRGDGAPANLARHALASHDLPTALRASVEPRASRRWRAAGPTRPPSTTPPRWRSTTAPRASSTTRRTRRARRPHRRRAVQLRVDPRPASPWSTPTSPCCPATLLRCRGLGCCWRASRRAAFDRERRREPQPGHAARRSRSSDRSPRRCAHGSSRCTPRR